MHIKQKFKDIERPKDINQIALASYLEKLYQNTYNFNQKVGILIDELKRVTSSQKFEQLRSKLIQFTYPGETQNIINEIKKAAEVICYKYANKLIATPERFKAEIRSATINACDAGALTNMQKILYSMDDSLYTQKYDFIQNLALEYVVNHKLAEHRREEVHKVNELIYQVSKEYKVTPPRDIHAGYRDSSQSSFKAFLDKHLEGRQGAYSFAQYVANSYLSKLPFAPKNGEPLPAKVKDQNGKFIASEEMEQIDAVADSLNIPVTSIIDFEEDGTEFRYHFDYMSIIQAASIQKLINEDIIEHQPLTIKYTQKVDIPAQSFFIRDAEGKLQKTHISAVSKNIEKAHFIIESPDGWYLTESIAGKFAPTRKLLDTIKLNRITINGQNIEDYLYRHLKDPLTAGKSFEDSLRVVINAKDEKGNTPLHLAVGNGQIAAMEELINLGANKNAVNYFGDTPLHLAIIYCQVGAIEKLTNLGANGNLRLLTNNGDSSHDNAPRGNGIKVHHIAGLTLTNIIETWYSFKYFDQHIIKLNILPDLDHKTLTFFYALSNSVAVLALENDYTPLERISKVLTKTFFFNINFVNEDYNFWVKFSVQAAKAGYEYYIHGANYYTLSIPALVGVLQLAQIYTLNPKREITLFEKTLPYIVDAAVVIKYILPTFTLSANPLAIFAQALYGISLVASTHAISVGIIDVGYATIDSAITKLESYSISLFLNETETLIREAANYLELDTNLTSIEKTSSLYIVLNETETLIRDAVNYLGPQLNFTLIEKTSPLYLIFNETETFISEASNYLGPMLNFTLIETPYSIKVCDLLIYQFLLALGFNPLFLITNKVINAVVLSSNPAIDSDFTEQQSYLASRILNETAILIEKTTHYIVSLLLNEPSSIPSKQYEEHLEPNHNNNTSIQEINLIDNFYELEPGYGYGYCSNIDSFQNEKATPLRKTATISDTYSDFVLNILLFADNVVRATIDIALTILPSLNFSNEATFESTYNLEAIKEEQIVNVMQRIDKDFELNYGYNSLTQYIAIEYNLIGNICELEPSYGYGYCLNIDYIE